MVVPRIVSSSMTPTIQEGDRLEPSPPTSLTVGAIVVFRNDTMLVCHRVTAIDAQGTLSTRGDAGRLRGRSARLCDRSGHGSDARGNSRFSLAKPTHVIRRGTTDPSDSDFRRPVRHPEYSCPCRFSLFQHMLAYCSGGQPQSMSLLLHRSSLSPPTPRSPRSHSECFHKLLNSSLLPTDRNRRVT